MINYMHFAENELEVCEYVQDYGALSAALFPFFKLYSSLEKGQLYIFRVGSGQVNSRCCLVFIRTFYLHGT